MDRRVFLTCDKDFGELVFRGHYPAVGIVLFRITPMSIATLVALICTVLLTREDWEGAFTVVKGGRIRRVQLSVLSEMRPRKSEDPTL